MFFYRTIKYDRFWQYIHQVAFCLLMGFQAAAHADYKDEAVLAARDAFRAGDVDKFERAASIAGSDHVMMPHIDIWRFKLTQNEKKAPWPDPVVIFLLEKYSGSMAAEQLRREWLLQLAKREEWGLFKIQWQKLLNRDEPNVQCLGLLADSASGMDVTARARAALLNPKELPETCILLSERLLANGKLNLDDLMARVRLMTQTGQKELAGKVYDYMVSQDPSGSKTMDGQFDKAYDKPSLYLSRLGSHPSMAAQELAGIALSRISRDTPDEAARWLTEQLNYKLSAPVKIWAWSQVALNAAKKWDSRALTWFASTTSEGRSDEASEWYVRSALLAKKWLIVQRVIEAMPPSQRGDPIWSYWLGRAKQAQGDAEGAKKLFLLTATPFSFYGKLSLEELGLPIKLPLPAPIPTEAEVKAAAATAGFQRALIWYQLGQKTEGFREFNFTLIGLKDRPLMAAAEWARRNDLYDRAIAAADRTVGEHQPSLRFLTPFRDVMQLQSQLAGIDETWVYGLIRQESRFISAAQSTVGASGLMQIMPATASLVAKKIGMTDYNKNRVNDVSLNLQLGINYLRILMDQLDNSLVLVSAGYNAGPGRSKAWRARIPSGEVMEGAIFTEAIPFNETRDYVKKVLSNATLYAALLEGKPQSLKSRLGMIIGRGSNPEITE